MLSIIQGFKPELLPGPIHQLGIPPQIVSRHDFSTVDDEINRLLAMRVIEPCSPEEGQFISNIFLRPKPDGSHRKILNLKHLNKYIKVEHFKMEGLGTALELVTKGCFMASIDLEKAYYSILMDPSFRKLLRFEWRGKLYQYRGLPNGLNVGPKVFTRVVKVLASELRKKGFLNVFYLDDSLLISNTYQECSENVRVSMSLLTSAGFEINQEKSVLTPSNLVRFLGFFIDSVAMTVYLPQDKVTRMESLCKAVLSVEHVTLQQVATLIGTMVSYLPAMQYGRLHYRAVERDKILGLRSNKGRFSATIRLSQEALHDVEWWLKNASLSGKQIDAPEHDAVLFCDASLEGYGCKLSDKTIGSRWGPEVLREHGSNINALELLAILLSLQSLTTELSMKCVLVRTDNTTAVCYVNEFGGVKSTACDKIAQKIWAHCIQHSIYLVAAHIPGVLNTDADTASRKFNDDIEYTLEGGVFKAYICDTFGTPTVDCFASRLNAKLPRYFSWKPDPFAETVDAFTLDWGNLGMIYIFCPFSLISKVLRKVTRDGALAVLVYPCWPGQVWWPVLRRMLKKSVRLPPGCLIHPVTKSEHRLRNVELHAGLIQ